MRLVRFTNERLGEVFINPDRVDYVLKTASADTTVIFLASCGNPIEVSEPLDRVTVKLQGFRVGRRKKGEDHIDGPTPHEDE